VPAPPRPPLRALRLRGHGRIDPAGSDLDFLVEFQDLAPTEYARSYFGLLHGLEDLFHRPIDLVTVSSVTNPHLLREIERHRTVLYAA